MVEKIITEYRHRVDFLIRSNFIVATQKGTKIVIGVVPQYYSIWDYGKINYG